MFLGHKYADYEYKQLPVNKKFSAIISLNLGQF